MISADFQPPADPGIATGFDAFFAVAVIVFLLIVGLIVAIAVRKYRVIKNAGHDPLTIDAALAAKVLDSDLLRRGTAVEGAAPAKSLEERLTDIDALHTRGIISDHERTAARAAILGG